MKPVEKIKTQKNISKIEAGNFDENDIDSLFMKLRAYSSGFPVFWEIEIGDRQIILPFLMV